MRFPRRRIRGPDILRDFLAVYDYCFWLAPRSIERHRRQGLITEAPVELEDFCHEVLTTLLALPTDVLAKEGDVKAWISRQIHHQLLRNDKRQGYKREAEATFSAELQPVMEKLTVTEQLLATQEFWATVEKVLADIEPELVMVFLPRLGPNEHLSLRETGERLGLKAETVRVRQSELLTKLRHPTRSRLLKEYLTRWGLDPEPREEQPNIWTPLGRAMIRAKKDGRNPLAMSKEQLMEYMPPEERYTLDPSYRRNPYSYDFYKHLRHRI